MNTLHCIACGCRTPRNFADEMIFNGVYCERCAPKILDNPPNIGSSVQRPQHHAWAVNLDSLTAGAFGDPLDPETLLRYWKAQEAAGYPYASENVKYFDALVQEKGQNARPQRAGDLLTPKKPEMRILGGFAPEGTPELRCPSCREPLTNYWAPRTKPKHCQFCGQALDWGEEEAKQ